MNCMYVCMQLYELYIYVAGGAIPEIASQRLLHFVSSLQNHLVDLGGEHSLDLVVDLGVVRLQEFKVLQSQLPIDELPHL